MSHHSCPSQCFMSIKSALNYICITRSHQSRDNDTSVEQNAFNSIFEINKCVEVFFEIFSINKVVVVFVLNILQDGPHGA